MDYVDTADIATALGLNREYVADRLVHRPDFPRPALVLSRKTRRWLRADFERWVQEQAIRAAGRSTRR